jgi:hypothetical protein
MGVDRFSLTLGCELLIYLRSNLSSSSVLSFRLELEFRFSAPDQRNTGRHSVNTTTTSIREHVCSVAHRDRAPLSTPFADHTVQAAHAID